MCRGSGKWRCTGRNDSEPVGVIGFCAGGKTQNEEDFEAESYGGAPYIRKAQRLGLADVGDPENTVFVPAYDVQVPGLHLSKKREHGLRAARWALAEISNVGVRWETAELVSAEPQGDEMILTFNKRVTPDDKDTILSGFSIAGEDGKFYMAHARHRAEGSYWDRTKIIHVWSPLVEKPVAVRYGWAWSPMGNLKVGEQQDLPIPKRRMPTPEVCRTEAGSHRSPAACHTGYCRSWLRARYLPIVLTSPTQTAAPCSVLGRHPSRFNAAFHFALGYRDLASKRG